MMFEARQRQEKLPPKLATRERALRSHYEGLPSRLLNPPPFAGGHPPAVSWPVFGDRLISRSNPI